MKRDFKKDIENGIYSNKDTIASLIPYSLDSITYALALDSSPILRKHIAAAIFKYENPDECYEDILNAIDVEKYSDENSYSPHDMVIHIIIAHATTSSLVLNNYNAWCLKETNGLSQELFVAGMIRIVSSFQSAAILLRHGFYVEVMPIFRMILEQLAWGCYLIKETDESKISKNRTQSNTTYLKEILGNDFGRLYGHLSSEAHLEPSQIRKYVHAEKDEIHIKVRSGKQCKDEVETLLLLLKAYGRVIYSGIEHFGIPDEFTSYYHDWSDFDKLQIHYLSQSLNGNMPFVRDDMGTKR